MAQAVWNLAGAKAHLSQLVRDTGTGPQEITRRGQTVAVVVSPEDYRALVAARERSATQYTLSDLRRLSEEIQREGGATLRIVRRSRRVAQIGK
jgi:prevent-host-death family protein